MNKQLTKSTNVHLKSQEKDKKNKKDIILGSIVAVFIASTPFLFYLYEYVPESDTWETILGTYNSNYYQNAKTGIWVFMMKVIPLLLAIVWFLTCRHWWYHALLVPVAMFGYQTFGAVNDEVMLMDEFHIIYLLPLMAIITPSIYLIRAKMFNRINTADKTMQELEAEFMIKPKSVWERIKQYF